MYKIEHLRSLVPALDQEIYGKKLIYFDNAATSQRPQAVIDLIDRMNSKVNANIHRAIHRLSDEATQLYEESREAVREFINAQKRGEIIFTSGTTHSINLVASSFAAKYLKKGDVILISEAEHHSNIVPWQLACEKTGAILKVIPIDSYGRIEMSIYESLLDERVKLVSVAHISNILGLVNPIKKMIEMAHKHDIPVLIDGAQGIVHENVDVCDLDCDFYVFSGHKVYAATGTGVLYGKERWLEEMPPYMGGGDMVDTVTFEKTTYASLPLKFEAGTPNFVGASTFKPAFEYVKECRSKEVKNYERDVKEYLYKELLSINGLKLYGIGEDKIPLFSFAVDGVHHSDIAQMLDKFGVAVRSGLMCAEPLIRRFNEHGMVRVSLAPYNTKEEAILFVEYLNKVINMLK